VTVRGTFGLILVAVALLLLVLGDKRAIIPERPLPTVEGTPLLDVSADRVARLEWERGPERLTLVHTPAGWYDAAGHRWPGDVVDVAIDALVSLRPRSVVEGEHVNMDEYGLAAATERLRVLDDTGRELLAMDIGNRNPAWTGNYARRDGRDEVLLVGSLLRWELDKLRSARDEPKLP
jgi:hypothetical protein